MPERSEGQAQAGGQAQEAFVQLLTEAQLPLLQYIATLLGDMHVAQNVLQETNMVLWRKADDYQPGTSFASWAHRVAYWQVKAYARDRGRDRLVFDEQLIEQLASTDPSEGADAEARLALRHCLTRLTTPHRELLRLRYEGEMSIKTIAKQVNKSENAIKTGLLRIRRTLLRCIERKLIVE